MKYNKPKMEILHLDMEDIVRTSFNETEYDENGEPIVTPPTGSWTGQ